MTAPDEPPFSWRGDVAGPILASITVVGTIALGVVAAFWAASLTPDLAEGYAVPSNLRRGADLPPPPVSYWLIWAAPVLTVTVFGVAAMMIDRRSRWRGLVVTVAFLCGYLPVAFLGISLGMGGFAPT
ncbi:MULTISPECIES: hypothetical protein [Nocardiaceae]|uniref:Uncharacterized protein n=1 Tax=Rhodococcoides corynebacterioides TaxID=53972 RepID=A0ABS2KUC3_9NOCA|nr:MULTISPECIES: hypothetical protein [Rhodococcus]MBM7415543.1 hypothetical protein [Rhodococcus corynebacterioides]MBP1118005.1 hypothetical protein [Rhodococcus sp. PvP016]